MKSNATYKKTLLKVRELLSAARRDLHAIVTNLVAVFNDRDFRADNGNADDFKAADVLNEFLGDWRLKFLDAKALLEEFPKAADWETTTVDAMLDQVRQRRQPEEKAKKTFHRVTQKEFEQEQEQRKSAESRAKFQAEMANERAKTIDELLAENAQLKRDLARAEGRIEELERQLSRFEATVS